MLGNFTTKENTAVARRSQRRAIKVSSPGPSSSANSLCAGKSFSQYLPLGPNFLTVSRFVSSGREVLAIKGF
jgi:hypothetical protein